jgi:hypothetical protein
MSWQQVAATLGAPIYGVLGLEPEPTHGWGGSDSNPTRLQLNFGPANILAVETSVQPIDAQMMLRHFGGQIAGSLDLLKFPLTIEERVATILVDSEYVEFRVLGVGAELWFATAEVHGRWVSLRGRGLPFGNFAVHSVDPATWQRT